MINYQIITGCRAAKVISEDRILYNEIIWGTTLQGDSFWRRKSYRDDKDQIAITYLVTSLGLLINPEGSRQ